MVKYHKLDGQEASAFLARVSYFDQNTSEVDSFGRLSFGSLSKSTAFVDTDNIDCMVGVWKLGKRVYISDRNVPPWQVQIICFRVILDADVPLAN